MTINDSHWIPVVGKDHKLVGPLPEILYLPEVLLKADLSHRELVISDDPVIKEIIIHGAISPYYLVISNLPNLRKISIADHWCLWMEFTNLPSLESVDLSGGVVSLRIDGARSLNNIYLGECPNIDFVSISQDINLESINVLGCLKLRTIFGIKESDEICVSLLGQIKQNQSTSRMDGYIYDEMTFTDIDIVGEKINESLKALSRSGRWWSKDSQSSSMFGNYGLFACEPKFKPYSFRILRPLERVYTGGTGETYPYVFIEQVFSISELAVEEVEAVEQIGNSSPEECLRYFLHSAQMSLKDAMGIEYTSDEDFFEFLINSAKDIPMDVVVTLPIRLSASVDKAQVDQLSEVMSDVGARFASDSENCYLYVRGGLITPEEEESVANSSAANYEIMTTINELRRLKSYGYKTAKFD